MVNLVKKEDAHWEKYEWEGLVAVLVSPCFGAGWSTWNTEYAEQLSMDKRIVEFVKNDPDRTADIERFLESIGIEGVYCGGYEDLQIGMVEKGMYFEITEYDGRETLMTVGDMGEFMRA